MYNWINDKIHNCNINIAGRKNISFRIKKGGTITNFWLKSYVITGYIFVIV